MDGVTNNGISGTYFQYNGFTFLDITGQLKPLEDPEAIWIFQENCVVFNQCMDRWRPCFTGAALEHSPVMADVKKEIDGQAYAAIGRFFDGGPPDPVEPVEIYRKLRRGSGCKPFSEQLAGLSRRLFQPVFPVRRTASEPARIRPGIGKGAMGVNVPPRNLPVPAAFTGVFRSLVIYKDLFLWYDRSGRREGMP